MGLNIGSLNLGNVFKSLPKLVESVTPKALEQLKSVAGFGNKSVFEAGAKSVAMAAGLALPAGLLTGGLASKLLEGTELENLIGKGVDELKKGLAGLIGRPQQQQLENGENVTVPGSNQRGGPAEVAAVSSAAQAATAAPAAAAATPARAASTSSAATAAATTTGGTGDARLDAFFRDAGVSDKEIAAIKGDPKLMLQYKLQARQEELQRQNEIMQKVSQMMMAEHETNKAIIQNFRV